VFSAWAVRSGYKKTSVEKLPNRVEFRDASLPGYGLESRGIELILQLQNNGKKGIRRCKENFRRDLN
jgi:hypothetical protein